MTTQEPPFAITLTCSQKPPVLVIETGTFHRNVIKRNYDQLVTGQKGLVSFQHASNFLAGSYGPKFNTINTPVSVWWKAPKIRKSVFCKICISVICKLGESLAPPGYLMT